MAWWSKKVIETVPENGINVISMVNGESFDYGWRDYADIYRNCPYIRAIEDYKALSLSNAIFRLYKKNAKNEDEEIYSHPTLNLINNPNPLQTGQSLLGQNMLFENIYGTSFLRGVKGMGNGFKFSKSIWALAPPEIDVWFVNNGVVDITSKINLSEIIDKFIYSTPEGIKWLSNDEIIYTPSVFLSTNDALNSKSNSKFETLKQSASNLMHIQESRGVVIKNRGAIGMLSPSSSNKDAAGAIPLTPDQKKEMLKEHGKLYGLTSGKHPIMIPTVSMDWKNMILPIKDLQLDETALAEFNVCCDLLGVPRGIFDDKTSYSNQSSLMKRLYQDLIIPYANKKMTIFGERLELNDMYLKADFSHVDCLQEDKKLKAETDKVTVEKLDIMYKSGVLSKGDYRSELGYIAESKEFNEYYVEPIKPIAQ